MGTESSECILIGGSSHGTAISVSDHENTIEIPIFAEGEEGKIIAAESYTRREINPEILGDDRQCFGFAGDDLTDTENLARHLASRKGQT